jgi:thioredoxin-like negative regulator of GroEL
LRAGPASRAHINIERAVKLRGANDDLRRRLELAEAQVALADCLIDLGNRKDAHALIDQAKAIHTAQAELSEHFKLQLRHVAARVGA